MDDITPLRQLTPQVLESEAHLFAPRPAYRFRSVASPMTHSNDPSAGTNPPYGASLNYYLKSAPEGEVKITILDQRGQTIRTLEAANEDEEGTESEQTAEPGGDEQSRLTTKAGINRFWWDLRYDKPKEAKLRTPPIGAPHVAAGPRGWRRLRRGSRNGPLVAPGTYTVKLTVGELELDQELEVLKDPSSAGSERDIRAQTNVLLEIHENTNDLVDMINQIEWTRKQLDNLEELLEDREGSEEVLTAAEELDEKLIGVEENLFQMRLTGGNASQDSLRWPAKLLTRLATLASGIGKSDFPPTTQQIEVNELLADQLTTYNSLLSELLASELPAFNTVLEEKDIPRIIVP